MKTNETQKGERGYRPLLLQSPGREFPDISSRQEVHHCFIPLLHGDQLRDLHVSAPACFPARSLPPPLSRAFSAGLSISCSGGRGTPVSGPCCLHRRTTSICRRLGVRIDSSTFALARARTSVGRIWLPVTSLYPLGWVCCSQLCLSVCSVD